MTKNDPPGAYNGGRCIAGVTPPNIREEEKGDMKMIELLRKRLFLFLVFIVCFCLSACGNSTNSYSSRSNANDFNAIDAPQIPTIPEANTYQIPVPPVPTIFFSIPSSPPASYYSDYYDGSGMVWEETPSSTAFCYIGYDEDEEILGVIFRSNESRAYIYYDFSWDEWDDFTSASSLGSYYNEYIKGQYDGDRYDDADALLERCFIR